MPDFKVTTPPESGVALVEHCAMRMFSAGTARRVRATARVILAALWRVSQAIGGSKSGGTEEHRRGDQRNEQAFHIRPPSGCDPLVIREIRSAGPDACVLATN